MKWRELFRFRLNPRQMAVGTMTAAGFNALGFLLLIAMDYRDGFPVWAPCVSIAVGVVIAAILGGRSSPLLNASSPFLFVINGLAVVAALTVINSYYALHLPEHIPLRASQLGCLFAALVAPSFLSGLFIILVQAGTALIQCEWLANAAFSSEATPTAAFGLAALLFLVFRYRTLILQAEYQQAMVEASATKALADKFLYIRDLMNTPLQTMITAHRLLRENSAVDSELLRRCERAVEQLNQLNRLLRQHEGEEIELSFDASYAMKL